ncbi:MAG: class I SAM-dependent methyltransferase [Acidobacteriota bacterium]
MSQSTFQSFWDIAYDSGDHLEHWESPQTPAELVALVAAGCVPRGSTALDIGCGAGAEVIFLARQGIRAIGVDSSRRAIELAREHAARASTEAQFHCVDASQLPLADQSIDFACDRGCFHSIGRDQRTAYAQELFRVLKPGARFLLRGAAADDEEEGVLAVDPQAIDRVFHCVGFTSGPIMPLDLVARSGTLPANLVILQRPAA